MVRKLTPADITDVHALSTAAGWNQTKADWQRIVRLASDTCFGIEQDGRVVATATLYCYGTVLAWVGMVLTQSCYMRRGYARTLLNHALGVAETMGVRSLMLDATDQGYPLYESLGFVGVHPIQRWEGDTSVRAQPGSLPPSGAYVQFDSDAFGADRSVLLADLQTEAENVVLENGFAYHRAGQRARYLGPCVAASPQDARRAIELALTAAPGEHWYWDLLPENGAAVDLATALGFRPARHLRRMCLGPEPPSQVNKIFAIAGFEYG